MPGQLAVTVLHKIHPENTFETYQANYMRVNVECWKVIHSKKAKDIFWLSFHIVKKSVFILSFACYVVNTIIPYPVIIFKYPYLNLTKS